jgi:hypothetical protein
MGIFTLRGLMAWFFVSPFVISIPPNPQWTTHSSPGYSVQLPPRWTASPDSQKGWVHLVGTQGEDAVIWPVFIPGEAAMPGLRNAQLIHLKLAAACPYHADWEAPHAVGPHTLRASGKSRNMTAVSVFTWATSPRGTAAYFYLAAARQADFAENRLTLRKSSRAFAW